MKDESRQRLDQDAGSGTGLGDDQGSRVGSPTPGSGKKTGAGAEAVEGSEPIESHDTEHRSKYGGGSRREDGGGQRTP
jgi:hypothetical protein